MCVTLRNNDCSYRTRSSLQTLLTTSIAVCLRLVECDQWSVWCKNCTLEEMLRQKACKHDNKFMLLLTNRQHATRHWDRCSVITQKPKENAFPRGKPRTRMDVTIKLQRHAYVTNSWYLLLLCTLRNTLSELFEGYDIFLNTDWVLKYTLNFNHAQKIYKIRNTYNLILNTCVE